MSLDIRILCDTCIMGKAHVQYSNDIESVIEDLYTLGWIVIENMCGYPIEFICPECVAKRKKE